MLDGPVASAQFNQAHNMCVDLSTGTVYVADTHNNAIRKIRNGTVTTLAGNGTQGDVDAQGLNARLYIPTGIQFYNGYIYITDDGNHKIKRVDTLGNVITIAGTGAIGHQDGNVLSATFYNPTGLSIDNSGIIYVADYLNHCIRKISGNQVTTYAGTLGVSGDQIGAASTALFNSPSEVNIDPQGNNLYVSDLLNNKVKVVSQSGTVSLLAGSGVAGFADGTGASAVFNRPSGMLWDLWGNIIIVDGLNYRIRRITTSGVVTTIAGTGAAGINNGPVATATFNGPADISIGPNGEIYCGDVTNNVIRMISVGDVGMNEYSSLAQISFFPNPTTDQIIVNSVEQKIKTISIFDMNGKLCKTIPVEGEPSQITIS
ncbi:MAG TPA: T9SS type A sorting domain-containing protein, partial [Bacteroidia bacterium]|nr:T9SS type A sorting domain-containing protein [Bacteroidia bacterium]